MKDFKKKSKEARYQILHDYRAKLMRYPNMYKPHSATVATADYFGTTIMTVYRAVKYIRSGGAE
jgi:hypothetical protein